MQAGTSAVSILPRLNERIRALESKGLGGIARFEGEERRVLEAVFPYCVYHRFIAELDALIERQLKRRSGSVAFADELLRQLGAYGFAEKDALRYFAIFLPTIPGPGTSASWSRPCGVFC